MSSLHHREYLRKKRNRKMLKYGLAFLAMVLLVGGLSYLSYRPSLRIQNVSLYGGGALGETEVRNEALAYLSGSYFWLFPKDNAVLYPKGSLKEHLKETFERIDSVEVSLDGLNLLNVVVKEKNPNVMWCGGSPGGEAEKCFFMDKDGIVFAEAPNFSGDAYFRFYGIVSGDRPIGSSYLSSTTEFRDMVDLANTAKNLSIHPLYINTAPNEEFVMVLRGGGEIYFDTKESLLKTAENLSAIMRTPALKIGRDEDLPIEYIDLRFGNKLFYKLK